MKRIFLIGFLVLGLLSSYGFAADTTAPTVSFTVPAKAAKGVAINLKPTATFSEVMDRLTITTATFTVTGPGRTRVSGTVTYVGTTAIFRPVRKLAANTTFSARIKGGATGAKDLAGNALARNMLWTFKTGAAPDTTAPTVSSTVPGNVATGIPINREITATFSEAMAPLRINTATFTVTGPGRTRVSGTVTYMGTTAIFRPASKLAANTTFSARIKGGATGARDLAGNALATNKVWTFTTRATPDTTAPRVSSTNPAAGATGSCINKSITATFSEVMDPLTINTATFTVTGPGTTPVSGTVTYVGRWATFRPASKLAASTTFTARIKGGATGARDLAGNALAANKVRTFTTGTQACSPPGPVALGTAASFGGFGGGAGMTNEGILTVINGDIGTTGASTLMTGFHDRAGDVYTQTPLNMGTVNGMIYTDVPPPGTVQKFAIAQRAAFDALTAFNNLSPGALPGGTDPFAGQLGGKTVAPGVYESASGAFTITGSNLTLDAKGDANAVWVFQMASTLTVGDTAPRSVILINGAQAKNVFWQVGSAATINGAGGGTMVGTIIAFAGVTFSTAGNVAITTLNGRALGLFASVTMVNTHINVPAP